MSEDNAILTEVQPESVHNSHRAMNAQPYEPELQLDTNGSDEDDEFNLEDGNHDNANDGFNFEEDRFTLDNPVWNDVKFAIFFIAVFVVFVINSMVLIIKHFDQFFNEIPPIGNGIPLSAYFQFKVVFLILFTSFVSFGISIFIFLFAGQNAIKCTSIGIKFLLYFSAITSVLSILVGQWINFLGFALLSGIIGFVHYKYQPLITLASNILQIVTSVLKKYPQTAIAALIGFFSTILFSGILSVGISCIYIAYGFNANGTPKFDSNGEVISKISFGLVMNLLFINFTALYIIDVVQNVMHVTIGGIYGTWYYLESTFSGMPRNEGVGSFRRAMTFNFGSVCFGSLFVVLFQCIAIAFLATKHELGVNESTSVISMFFNFILRIAGFFVGYFNLYAYSFIALYGASMVKSAKSTLKFFKQRGIQAMLNDFIISLSLGFYCSVAAIFSVILMGIYLWIIKKVFTISDDATVPLLTLAFFITFNITSILIMTVVSGSSVFFLALNKDPAVFQESHPFEFQEISRCYPRVLDKLEL